MLWKFLSLLVVFAAAYFLYRRAFGAPPLGRAADRVRCRVCGAQRLRGELCDCEQNPTP